MEHTQALAILDALAGGVDPISGESFPADSPYQHPDVVRALFHAVRLLSGDNTTAGATAADTAAPPAADAKPARTSPGNTGKPWSADEDDRLVAAFDAGTAPPDLARLHGRSKFAVEVRLARFERLPLPQGTRFPPRSTRPAESDTAPLHADDAATLHYRVTPRPGSSTRQHPATSALQ